MVRMDADGGSGSGGDDSSGSASTSSTDLDRVPDTYRDDVRDSQQSSGGGGANDPANRPRRRAVDPGGSDGGGGGGSSSGGGGSSQSDAASATQQNRPTGYSGNRSATSDPMAGRAGQQTQNRPSPTGPSYDAPTSPARQNRQNRPTGYGGYRTAVDDPVSGRAGAQYQDRPSRRTPAVYRGPDTLIADVEQGGHSTRQALNRSTGPGLASWEVVNRARAYERELVDSRPGLTADDVSIEVVGRDGELGFEPDYAEPYREEQYAGDVQAQYAQGQPLQSRQNRPSRAPASAAEAGVDDVEFGVAGTEPTAATQREIVTARADRQLDQRFGEDLQAGQDFVVSPQGRGRYGVELTESFERAQAGEQIATRTGRENLSSVLVAGAAAGGLSLDRDVAGNVVGATVDAETAREFGLQRGRDFTLEETATGYRADPTQAFEERVVAQQLGLPASVVEEGEDYRVTESGEFELTAEGRRSAIEAQVAEQGYVMGSPQRGTYNVMGFSGEVGPEAEPQEVQSVTQLQFNEEGQLVGVDPVDHDGLHGVAQDVAQWGSEYIVQPGTDFVGDAMEFGGRGMIVADPMAMQYAPEEYAQAREGYVASAQDALRVPGDEVTQTTWGEAIGEGAGMIVTAPAALPEMGLTAVETAWGVGDFAADEVNEPGAVDAAPDIAAAGIEESSDFIQRSAATAIQNPGQTAGAFVASAGVMGGAAAVSTRAGTAARWTIQPGEEAIGYGGAGLFRRLPGDRTSRAGERLFPNNEPVIFSEETAIRGVRRAGSGLRSAGSRVRSSVPDISLEVNPDAPAFQYGGPGLWDVASGAGGRTYGAARWASDPARGAFARARSRLDEAEMPTLRRTSDDTLYIGDPAPELLRASDTNTRGFFDRVRDRLPDESPIRIEGDPAYIGNPADELLEGGSRTLSDRIGEYTDRVGAYGADVAARTPDVTSDVALQQSFTRGSRLPWGRPDVDVPSFDRPRLDLGQRWTMAELRAGEFSRGVSQRLQQADWDTFDQRLVSQAEAAGEGAGEARARAATRQLRRQGTEFRFGYETARGTGPVPAEVAELEAYPGEFSEGTAFQTGHRTAEAVEWATDVPRDAWSRGTNLWERRGDVRDLTLRVGEVDTDAGRMQAERLTTSMDHIDMFADEFGAESGQTAFESTETDTAPPTEDVRPRDPPAGDVGVAVQRVQGAEAQLEAPRSEFETFGEIYEPMRTEFVGEGAAQPMEDVGAVQEPWIDERVVQEPGVGEFEAMDTRQAWDQRVGVETEPIVESDITQEYDQEFYYEPAADLETRQEIEPGLEFRYEYEGRREVEGAPWQREQREEWDPNGGSLSDVRFANPIASARDVLL